MRGSFVVVVCVGACLALPSSASAAVAGAGSAGGGSDSSHTLAISSLFPVASPRGLIVTTGGWLYCANVQRLARDAGFTLLCGRFAKDGYTADNLRSRRHVDWGNPTYLRQFAAEIRRFHRRVGGRLILVGTSYSGFGVATLASHHPELRPDMVVVVDSYLDLVARRRHAGTHPIGREIDLETGGSLAALRARSVSVSGLARLVRQGTKLAVVWSISTEEKRFFRGATCARDANAETLARLARTLRRAVTGWVTTGEHGFDLWNNAPAILAGNPPGRPVTFPASGAVPAGSYC